MRGDCYWPSSKELVGRREDRLQETSRKMSEEWECGLKIKEYNSKPDPTANRAVSERLEMHETSIFLSEIKSGLLEFFCCLCCSATSSCYDCWHSIPKICFHLLGKILSLGLFQSAYDWKQMCIKSCFCCHAEWFDQQQECAGPACRLLTAWGFVPKSQALLSMSG